jgi:uncharacterized OB-fold protein
MSAVASPAQQAVFFPASAPWREENGRLRLQGSRCSNCKTTAFPHHSICPSCGQETGQDTVELSDNGTIYTFSHIHTAPKGFATPYSTGYVDLPEGVRLFGQIDTKPSDIAIGDKVAIVLGTVRTDEAGRPVLSYKFKRI